ncbi:GtrA family protein [Xylella fastidiosa]|uniref:GtrA family protein n=2 Tax=Xylella fastidiosa TaxID=2371 RepID=UPI0021560692|nr:GtrA family protein [Xylella fastidiosa]MCO5546291.1 hypothetical protein [Xylella fastidiosa]
MPAGSNRNRINSALRGQLLRYLLNGLVATAVHYTILRFTLEVLGLHSAGLANGIAAIFGIIVSFIGNRYFVFRIVQVPLAKQALLFILTYFCIALIHTCILYFWTDVYNLNYTLGFLMATAMQVVFSFFLINSWFSNEYVFQISFGYVFFIVVMLAFYYIHIIYFKVNVVFYASLLDGVLAAVLVGLLFWIFRFFNNFSSLEIVQLLVIWLLGAYLFAISIPTVVDRSLSFYILEKLQQRGGGIREDAFQQIFQDEYMREHHLVEVRLTEQLQSGTIYIHNGCVKLTERGERLASFSRFYRKNLLPKHRLLMGNYTDTLTDPFRESRMKLDYRCQ